MTARLWTIYYILFASFVANKCLYIQDLGGTWNLTNAKKAYNLNGTVPGGIYTDLMNKKILDDVFYGFNDIESRWVSKEDWIYSRTFVVNTDLITHENINLVCDGVDTFAIVSINNIEIGSTDNMFVRYIFNIKPHIQLGINNITVSLKSPVRMSAELFNEQSKQYVVPPLCVPDSYHGECHVNHIRKMQASFAWDWGPAFPSVGIWKNIYLESYNTTVIRHVTINTIENGNNWDISLHTYLAANINTTAIQGSLVVKLFTDITSVSEVFDLNLSVNKNGEFVSIQNLTIPQMHVSRWWPNDYGDANLYQMKVSFISNKGREQSVKRIKIGFRTVEVVQNPLEKGNTFYFKVNGIPIFAKGSNIIPMNILPELGQNESAIRFLLQSSKDVHMNMLRVWGGGLYESDIFYEVADELGIMIWQDLMFACSMYPTKDTFLRSITEEIREQIRRLQHHPSIVVWAGNNENEAALRQNWYGTKNNFSLYKSDYIKLYVNTIKPEVLANDNSREYLTSSPSNGLESESEGHIAQNPQSNFYGDVHYYNYIVNSWNANIYPVTRFASEYGYQSLPSIQTLLTATNNTDDLSISSEFLRSRQHHPVGYPAMTLLTLYNLKLPSRENSNFDKAYVYYSQITQAMAVKIETEYYRQWRSNLNSNQEGLTMGALYWQLNDVWVAPSWASIDFKLNWKMLHYFAKNFFAPVIVTGHKTPTGLLNIYVVSDLLTSIYNASLTIKIFKWESFVPVYEKVLTMDILSGISRQVASYELTTFLMDAGCGTLTNAKNNCLVHFTICNSKNVSLGPDNHVFPVSLKFTPVQKPIMRIESIRQTNNDGIEFEINIKTSLISLFVWLESRERGRFSENGFLQVNETKFVKFTAERPITLQEFNKSLTVTNLLEYM